MEDENTRGLVIMVEELKPYVEEVKIIAWIKKPVSYQKHSTEWFAVIDAESGQPAGFVSGSTLRRMINGEIKGCPIKQTIQKPRKYWNENNSKKNYKKRKVKGK